MASAQDRIKGVLAGASGGSSAQSKQKTTKPDMKGVQSRISETIQRDPLTAAGFTRHSGTKGEISFKASDGTTYRFDSSAADWMRRAYQAQYGSYYGTDAQDQANKASGAMPRSFLQSYNAKSKADQALYQMGLPSSKWLGKYLGEYEAWKGTGEVYELSDDAKAYVQDQWKKSWKYSGSLEDMKRQQEGRMPEALEEKYFAKGGKQFGLTKSFADQYYLEQGLPGADELGQYISSYNDWKGKSDRIAEFYAAVSNKALLAEVESGIRDDDGTYEVIRRGAKTASGKEYDPYELADWEVQLAPPKYEYEQVKGSDYYTKLFYDTLNEDEWADVRAYLADPVKAAKEIKPEDYASEADYQAALIKAQEPAKPKKGEPDPGDPYSLSVSAAKWREFYGDDTTGVRARIAAIKASDAFMLDKATSEKIGDMTIGDILSASGKANSEYVESTKQARALYEQREAILNAKGNKKAVATVVGTLLEAALTPATIAYACVQQGYSEKEMKAVKDALMSAYGADDEAKRQEVLDAIEAATKGTSSLLGSGAAAPAGDAPAEKPAPELGDFDRAKDLSQFFGEDGKLDPKNAANAVMFANEGYENMYPGASLTDRVKNAAEMLKQNGIDAAAAYRAIRSVMPEVDDSNEIEWIDDATGGRTGAQVIASIYGTDVAEVTTPADVSARQASYDLNAAQEKFVSGMFSFRDEESARKSFDSFIERNKGNGNSEYANTSSAIKWLFKSGVPKDMALSAVGDRVITTPDGKQYSVGKMVESIYAGISANLEQNMQYWTPEERANYEAAMAEFAYGDKWKAWMNTPSDASTVTKGQYFREHFMRDGRVIDQNYALKWVYDNTDGTDAERISNGLEMLRSNGIDRDDAYNIAAYTFSQYGDALENPDGTAAKDLNAMLDGVYGQRHGKGWTTESWISTKLPDPDPLAKQQTLQQFPEYVELFDNFIENNGWATDEFFESGIRAEDLVYILDNGMGKSDDGYAYAPIGNDDAVENIVGEYIRRAYDRGEINDSQFEILMSGLRTEMETRRDDIYEQTMPYWRAQARAVGMNDFQFDNALRRLGYDRLIDEETAAMDYFIWGGGARAEMTPEQQKQLDGLEPDEQATVLSEIWSSMTDEARNGYVSMFTQTEAYNPDIHKTVGEYVGARLAGGWFMELFTNLASSAVSFADMVTGKLGNEGGKDWEATEFWRNAYSIWQNMSRPSDEQSRLAHDVNVAVDLGDEMIRMYADAALGQMIAGGLNWAPKDLTKVSGLKKVLGWLGNKAHTLLQGGKAIPFIAQAMGNYYSEARQAGESIDVATAYAIPAGLLEGWTETLATSEWFGKGFGGKRFAAQVVKDSSLFGKGGMKALFYLNNLASSTFGEAVEEGISYVGTWATRGIIQKFVPEAFPDNPNIGTGEWWSGLGQDMLMGGLLGAVGATFASPTTSAYQSIYSYMQDSGKFDMSAVLGDIYYHNTVVNGLTQGQVDAYRARPMSILTDTEFATVANDYAQAAAAQKQADDTLASELSKAKAKLDKAIGVEAEKRAAWRALVDNPQDTPEWNAELQRASAALATAVNDAQKAQEVYEAEASAAQNTHDSTVAQMQRAMTKAQDKLNAHAVYLHDLYNGVLQNLPPYAVASENARNAAPIGEQATTTLDSIYGNTVAQSQFDTIDKAAEDMVGATEVTRERDALRLRWADALNEVNQILTAAKAGTLDQYLQRREAVRGMGEVLYKISLNDPTTVGKTDMQWGIDSAAAALAHDEERRAGNPDAERNFTIRKQNADADATARLAKTADNGSAATQTKTAVEAATPDVDNTAQAPAQTQGQEVPAQQTSGAQATPAPAQAATEKSQPAKAETAEPAAETTAEDKASPKRRKITTAEKAGVSELAKALGRTVMFEEMDGDKSGYCDGNDVIHINSNVLADVSPTSPDFFKSAVGTVLFHELTHTLERSSAYADLQDYVLGKGRVPGYLDQVYNKPGAASFLVDNYATELRKDPEFANESDEQIMERARKEVTADFCQRYLNTQEFADRLARDYRNAAWRIADWARHTIVQSGLFKGDRTEAQQRAREGLDNLQYLYTKALLKSGAQPTGGMRRYSMGSDLGIAAYERIKAENPELLEDYPDIAPIGQFDTVIAPVRVGKSGRAKRVAVWSDAAAGLEHGAIDKLTQVIDKVARYRSNPVASNMAAKMYAIPLKDVFSHDAIFAVYGGLGLDDVKISVGLSNGPHSDMGSYDMNQHVIYLDENDVLKAKQTGNTSEIEDAILHEIQHAIQVIEGNYTGTDPQTAAMYVLGQAAYIVEHNKDYKDLKGRKKRDAIFAAVAYLTYGKDRQRYETELKNGFPTFAQDFQRYIANVYRNAIGEREAYFAESDARRTMSDEEYFEAAKAVHGEEQQFDVGGAVVNKSAKSIGMSNEENINKLYENAARKASVDYDATGRSEGSDTTGGLRVLFASAGIDLDDLTDVGNAPVTQNSPAITKLFTALNRDADGLGTLAEATTTESEPYSYAIPQDTPLVFDSVGLFADNASTPEKSGNRYSNTNFNIDAVLEKMSMQELDDKYDAAYKAKDKSAMDDIILECARRAGADRDENGNIRMTYHGTLVFGFTEKDIPESDVAMHQHNGMFAATNLEVASGYTTENDGTIYHTTPTAISDAVAELGDNPTDEQVVSAYQKALTSAGRNVTGLEKLTAENVDSYIESITEEHMPRELETIKRFVDSVSGTLELSDDEAYLDPADAYEQVASTFDSAFLYGEQEPSAITGQLDRLGGLFNELSEKLTDESARTLCAEALNAVEAMRGLVQTYEDLYEIEGQLELANSDPDMLDDDEAADYIDAQDAAKLAVVGFEDGYPHVYNSESIINGGIYKFAAFSGKKPLIVDAKGKRWDNIAFTTPSGETLDNSSYGMHAKGATTTNDIASWAEKHGYTSVIIRNVIDPAHPEHFGNVTDDYIVFTSNQFKSLDTITYDDAGNYIKPSQRFDRTKNDFRYSRTSLDLDKYLNDYSPDALKQTYDEAAKAGDAVAMRAVLDRLAVLAGTPIDDNVDLVTVDSNGKPIDVLKRFGLTNRDVRYSRGSLNFDEALARYGAMEQGMSPRARDIAVPTQASDDRKNSLFYRSFLESDKLPDSFVPAAKNAMRNFSYEVYSNADMIEAAQNEIARDGGLTYAINKVKAQIEGGQVTALNNAKALQLIKEAGAIGDGVAAIDLAATLAVAATESGRAVQIFSTLKRMGGAGAAAYWAKIVKRMNDQYAKYIQRGKMQAIDLNSAELQPLVQNLINAQTLAEVSEAEDALTKKIGELLPLSFTEKLRNWRFFSMLANPVTHMRNITGNTLMYGLRGLKDVTASGIEAGLHAIGKLKDTSRAHSLSTRDRRAYRNLAKLSYQDNAKEIEGENRFSFDMGLNQNKRAFDWKPLNKAAQKNSYLLGKEDVWFLKWNYYDAFAGYCAAQGFDPNSITQEQAKQAHVYAMEQAQKATFHDASALATWLNKTPAGAKLFVESVMPFKKTPINIAKRGIEYSPVGIIHGIYEAVDIARGVKGSGKYTAAHAIDTLSCGLTGSALAALGFFLAKCGLLRAKGEEEKYEAFLEATGSEQTHSLHLSIAGTDISISLAQFAPAMMPMLMGAAWYESAHADGEDLDFGDVLDVLSGITNPMMEMSFLSSLNEALKNYTYGKDNSTIGGQLGTILLSAGKNYVSQFLPTIGQKIADMADPTSRSASGDKTSPLGAQDYYPRQLAKKIPGATYALQPNIDVHGDVVRRDGFWDWALAFANDFILPGKVKIKDRDAADEELTDIYWATGNTSILPSLPTTKYLQWTENKVKHKVDFNAAQFTEYKSDMGTAYYAAIKEEMRSADWESIDYEERAKRIEDALKAAKKQVDSMWKERFIAEGK